MESRQSRLWLAGGRSIWIRKPLSYSPAVSGYRPVGLFAALAPGHGQAAVGSPGQVDQRLLTVERQAGLPDRDWNRWPNQIVNQAEYAAGALNVARAFYQHRDYAGMRRALLNALAIQPGNSTATKDLSLLKSIGHG